MGHGLLHSGMLSARPPASPNLRPGSHRNVGEGDLRSAKNHTTAIVRLDTASESETISHRIPGLEPPCFLRVRHRTLPMARPPAAGSIPAHRQPPPRPARSGGIPPAWRDRLVSDTTSVVSRCPPPLLPHSSLTFKRKTSKCRGTKPKHGDRISLFLCFLLPPLSLPLSLSVRLCQSVCQTAWLSVLVCFGW